MKLQLNHLTEAKLLAVKRDIDKELGSAYPPYKLEDLRLADIRNHILMQLAAEKYFDKLVQDQPTDLVLTVQKVVGVKADVIKQVLAICDGCPDKTIEYITKQGYALG